MSGVRAVCGAGARGCGYALPVGSGDVLATAVGVAVATVLGTAEGCAEVGDGLAVAQALPLVGTGTGVADPRGPAVGLATGVGQNALVGLATGV